MKKRTFLTCMLVAAGLVCGFEASAQGGGGGGGGGGGRGRGMGGFLTPEQTQQVNDALQGSSDVTALRDKMNAAMKDAVKAALDKGATDAGVKAKIEAVAKIQTDMAMLRYTKGVKGVVSSITDDQKATLDSNPNGYAGAYATLFSGGGFGGGRGAGGGRRGGGGGGGGGGGN